MAGLASVPARSASGARAAVEIVAVTTRDEFLIEIGAAVSGQSSVHVVDSITEALARLSNARQLQVVAIDALSITDLRDAVGQLGRLGRPVPTLVYTPPGILQTTTTSLGARVLAVFPLPIDGDALSTTLADVVNTAIVAAPPAPDTGSPAATGPATTARSSAHSSPREASTPNTSATRPGAAQRRTRLLVPAAAAIGVVLVAAVSYIFTGSPDEPATAEAVTPGDNAISPPPLVVQSGPDGEADAAFNPILAETELFDGAVEDLLDKARVALRNRRYTEPAGDNALIYYRSAVAADPDNAEARDGLTRVAALIRTRFDDALKAGDITDAEAALAQFQSAGIDDAAAGAMQAQFYTGAIAHALDRHRFERAGGLIRAAQDSGAVPEQRVADWKAELATRSQSRLAALALERARSGRLDAPAEDSAEHYLAALRATDPPDAVVAPVLAGLADGYLEAAGKSLAAGRQAEADRALAGARRFGIDDAEIARFKRDSAAANAQRTAAEAGRLAGLVNTRLRQGRLLEPANDNAAHYLTQLQALDRDDADVRVLGADLATRLLAAATAASGAGNAAEAAAAAEAARRWGAEEAAIQAAIPATAGATSASGNATAGAGGGAMPDTADLEKLLKHSRYVPPEYPERAYRKRLAGTVTLGFVVATDGTTRDVRVTDADPPEIFDDAAIDAVRAWRFDEVVVNGQPVEVPTTVTIRFQRPR